MRGGRGSIRVGRSFSQVESLNSWFSNLFFFPLRMSAKLQSKFSHVLFSFSTFRAGSLVRFYFLYADGYYGDRPVI